MTDPRIGQRIRDGYGYWGTVTEKHGPDYMVVFDRWERVIKPQTDRQIDRMIANAERWEEEKKEHKIKKEKSK